MLRSAPTEIRRIRCILRVRTRLSDVNIADRVGLRIILVTRISAVCPEIMGTVDLYVLALVILRMTINVCVVRRTNLVVL